MAFDDRAAAHQLIKTPTKHWHAAIARASGPVVYFVHYRAKPSTAWPIKSTVHYFFVKL